MPSPELRDNGVLGDDACTPERIVGDSEIARKTAVPDTPENPVVILYYSCLMGRFF